MEKTSEFDRLLDQFTIVAQAFNLLADRVEKEGHSDWISEAMSLKKPSKETQVDPKTNIIPKEAWKITCAKLHLPFEYTNREEKNGQN